MALKTLEELNREFLLEMRENNSRKTSKPELAKEKPPQVKKNETKAGWLRTIQAQQPRQAQPQPKEKSSRVFAIISNLLFCLMILVIVYNAIFTGRVEGKPKTILGYSYFTVLSSSMKGEIPKGSFILVQNTAPQYLQVGDNITFVREAGALATHKIIDIEENHQESGVRGFQTKGVNNASPDREIVNAASVVGKVVLVIPVVGAAILNLKTNIYLIFIVFGLCVVLSYCLSRQLAKSGRSVLKERVCLYKAAAS